MLISEEEFVNKYSQEEFINFIEKIKNYVKHPEILEKEILEKDEKTINSLTFPKPDEFSYYLTRYKGLLEDERRLKNFFISLKQPRNELKRDYLPTILDIEPISRCNFRCIMCQLSGWKNAQRSEDLKIEDYKELIDSQYGLTEIKLQGIGEPLLHPDFFEMVKYAVSKKIWVRTTINGSLLHNENFKRLIDSGINDIQISFDGATKEIFEKIRKKSNFEQVVENVTLLNTYANKLNKNVTNMWVLLQEYNKHQILDFIKIAQKMQFKKMTFSIGLGFWGQEKWEKTNKKRVAKDAFSEKIKQELIELKKSSNIDITIWDLQSKFSTKEEKTLCPWPFNRYFIGSDMRISPCCMIANPDIYSLGNQKEIKTWNTQEFINFREKHLLGQIPDVCKNCYE
ncbi:hypothetical protein CRU99_10350 [Malaciobacter mytili]|uniref:Radical SAM core domain-containing protein n=1 Tax=Malaciobacter mytili LMG 24559 TaxID=1032238 RepID=A0AAX2AK13_9BACT|nr:radical SAM protein [Malaciobacter mytili]AXH16145.1 radical SAM superfamily enzyme, MoaA/NifB/PqqE/SkfB family [Malaciobacter mytili LMG 24559]RXI40515.1 hypothetical protein CRU99_10350 [Malaciobacter mytili]RXK17045.1 hypothetical protein CP985_00100 [Malaciobacter mytili LMG 24559]